MSISTREQLKDHIHSIHDFIRNSGAGYNMTAMKIFMLFYGLKVIEPIIGKTTLDKKICTFSKITDNAKDIKKSLTTFIDKHILEDIHNNQHKNDDWKYYLFHQIPTDLCNEFWETLIELIDDIPTKTDKKSKTIDQKFNVDLSGKVYEYFIGRDPTAISELGAYFTNPHITQYIINKINPTLDDDDCVNTMIDPFGGSGGFTLSYAKYMNDKFKIDWNKNINNIYHFDMNDDVIKIAGLEICFSLLSLFFNNSLFFGSSFNSFFIFVNRLFNSPINLSYFNICEFLVVLSPPYGGFPRTYLNL